MSLGKVQQIEPPIASGLRSALKKPLLAYDDRPVKDDIRQILAQHGRLPVDVDRLADDDDLYQAGMTSHASVSVMLALEDHFDIEFPDSMLTRDVFESVSSIATALTSLQAEAAA